MNRKSESKKVIFNTLKISINVQTHFLALASKEAALALIIMPGTVQKTYQAEVIAAGPTSMPTEYGFDHHGSIRDRAYMQANHRRVRLPGRTSQRSYKQLTG